MKSWIYHICLKLILWICRKDPFYASLFIVEAEVLREELKIPPGVLAAAGLFVSSIKRHPNG